VTRKKASKWRSVRRGAALLGALVLLFLAAVVIDGWQAFGHRAEGARLERMQRSPQWKGGRFVNPEPIVDDVWGMLSGMFHASAHASPDSPPPAVTIDPSRLRSAPATGLRVTWFGHSSTLIEIDGERFLTDPVWSERASPLSWLGPVRWFEPPIALEALSPIDAVVVSHDHYDHLDQATLVAMKAWNTKFVVPLGVGAHLAYWGIPEDKIVELDWWERARVGDVEIVSTPARHASGRHLFDRDQKLWSSYAFIGPKHRAYFSGDTGLFPGMKQIGERLGPFDVTLIETGQYHGAWPDWHVGPEQAVVAHRWLRGRVMVPVHWGLLQLAYHGWTEPVERTLSAADPHAELVLVPKPGESVEPGAAPRLERWWPQVPWETAEQSPVVSTQVPKALLTSPLSH
jgi:L-ascorbate metabolism protein UlaG (beta-lactamase superfamily)